MVTPSIVVAVTLAAFSIGLAKGGLAGAGSLTTIIVAQAVPADVALGTLLPFLMVGDVVALSALWRHVDWPIVKRILPTAAVGVAGSALFLRQLSAEAIEIALVAIIVAFSAYRMALLAGRVPAAGPTSRLASPAAGSIAGLATGVTSTIAHAGGPPVSIYLLSKGLRPLAYAGTSAAIFWAINWMKVPGYAMAGLFDWPLLWRLAPCALAIVPGVVAGRYVAARVQPRTFELMVLFGMLVGAGLLIAR